MTGACLSHLDRRVTCIDKEEGRISALKENRMPFYEPGLKELVLRGVHQKRLTLADLGGLPYLVGEADAVPVGSGDYVSMLIREGIEAAGDDNIREAEFLVASNPEFLSEVLVDGRNVLEPVAALEAGLHYKGFGRG